jgi:hypothetical protein
MSPCPGVKVKPPSHATVVTAIPAIRISSVGPPRSSTVRTAGKPDGGGLAGAVELAGDEVAGVGVVEEQPTAAAETTRTTVTMRIRPILIIDALGTSDGPTK